MKWKINQKICITRRCRRFAVEDNKKTFFVTRQATDFGGPPSIANKARPPVVSYGRGPEAADREDSYRHQPGRMDRSVLGTVDVGGSEDAGCSVQGPAWVFEVLQVAWGR